MLNEPAGKPPGSAAPATDHRQPDAGRTAAPFRDTLMVSDAELMTLFAFEEVRDQPKEGVPAVVHVVLDWMWLG